MQSRTRRLRVCRSASMALQRWLANFVKISQFWVFCCILGLILAKSQIFNFRDFWKFSVTFFIIFKCPEYFSTLKMWLEIDLGGYQNFRFFMVLPSILQNFETTCSFSRAFSQTWARRESSHLILLILLFISGFNWIVKLFRIILITGRKLRFCLTGHAFCWPRYWLHTTQVG